MRTSEQSPRDRLAIALDVSSVAEARQLAQLVTPTMAVAKIGLQLYVANGPAAVEAIRTTGMDVLLDLKFHDIPNTVYQAAREAGRLGVRFVTSHAQGGHDMLKAAIEGLTDGAAAAEVEQPTVLAI